MPADTESPSNIHDAVTGSLFGDNQGIPTSFPDLDALTGGLQPGHFTVIAGRPSHGSSILALTIARAALSARRHTFYVALESTADDVAGRFVAAEAQVAMTWITAGAYGPEDADRLRGTQSRIQTERPPLILKDNLRTAANVETILDAYADGGPELLVIDGAELLDIGDSQRPAHERVIDSARLLKSWAVDRRMHVIATVHLPLRPRDSHRDQPNLTDFGWRQAYAHSADLVILVDRPDAEIRNSPRLGTVDLILAKHRNGPTAVLTTAFQGHYARIVPIVEPDPADEAPDRSALTAVAQHVPSPTVS